MLQRIIHSLWLGFQTLTLHKLRSLLTVLGVVFGVASVIVMLAVGEGARAEAVAAISELGATNVIVRSVKPSDLHGGDSGSAGAIRYGLTMRDLDRITATLPESATVSPTRDHRRQIQFRNGELKGRVVGVFPVYQDLHDLQLAGGRFIAPLDCDRGTPVAVLGAGAAARLFPLDNPLGHSIRIGNDRYYQVVGILRARGTARGSGGGAQGSEDIYIPFTTDQQRFGENISFDPGGLQPPEKVEVSQLTVAVSSTEQVRGAAMLIRSILAQNGRDRDVTLTVPLDLLEKAEQTQRVFTVVLTSIASISLLVGGIGIMNIMLATVTERTREIGIRRALGAKRSDITIQFLIETITLSGTGGLLGILLGFAGAYAASAIGGVPAIVQPWSPLLAVSISLLVGILFGIYPARRAAAMNPIEALRHE